MPYSLSLSELIESATNEIVDAQRRRVKSGYKVQELTLELHVEASVQDSGKLSLNVLGIGGGASANRSTASAHKITLKLVPKSSRL